MKLKKLLKLRPQKIARRVSEYVLFALMWRGSKTQRPAIDLLIDRQIETTQWSVRAKITNTCICRIYVLGLVLREGGAFRLGAASRKDALMTSRPFGRTSVLTATSVPEALPVGRTLSDLFWLEPKDAIALGAPAAADFVALYRRHDDKQRIHLLPVRMTVSL